MAWLVLASTLAADRLQKSGWGVSTPFLRRLRQEGVDARDQHLHA